MNKEKAASLLGFIKRELEVLLSKVEELETLLEGVTTEPPDYLKAKLKVLMRVKKEGGTIDKNKLREYWVSLGRDPRGFGGLFQGYGKLVSIAGNKVALSPEAETLIEEYKDWLQQNS
jgi:hypothetical protein